MKTFREHSLTKVAGVGISDAQLDQIKEGLQASVAVLKGGWHNPSLVDFPDGALKPIWLRCTTQQRRNALDAAFKKMAEERGSSLLDVALYTPIYLYRCHHNDTSYRLSSRGTLPSAAPEAGGTLDNGGKPLCYILARPMKDSIPLYQYGWKSDNRRWRYETADWAEWMTVLEEGFGGEWERVSALPMGYVLNPDRAASYQGRVSTLAPVYGYCQRNPNGKPYFYWSLDSEDHTRAPAESWVRYEPTHHDAPPGRSFGTPAHPDSGQQGEYPTERIMRWEKQKAPQWYGWTRT